MAEELNHKACVDLLMNEYGVKKEHRPAILTEVLRIWHPERMPHFVIIRSIRGFMPVGVTHSLEMLLEQHKTHEPKHKKGSNDYQPGKKRDYREPSYENQ